MPPKAHHAVWRTVTACVVSVVSVQEAALWEWPESEPEPLVRAQAGVGPETLVAAEPLAWAVTVAVFARSAVKSAVKRGSAKGSFPAEGQARPVPCVVRPGRGLLVVASVVDIRGVGPEQRMLAHR